MASPGHRLLRAVAVLAVAAFVALAVHDRFAATGPGDGAYHEANKLFEDGFYERAAARYREALAEAPDHLFALRGLARSQHMLGRHQEALALYDEAIERAPDVAATYANRGITLDTLGRHEEALRDYERALDLDPRLGDGPHWLTRFLRNQPERPPTVADRARYLRSQLAKPEDERLLRVPEIDARQRPYRL